MRLEFLGECEEKEPLHFQNWLTSLKGNVLVLFSRVEGHGDTSMHERIAGGYNEILDYISFTVVRMYIKERGYARLLRQMTIILLLVAYGTMSTGVNIKNLHHVVFASPSKSRVRVLQSIGRGLRKGKGKNECDVI